MKTIYWNPETLDFFQLLKENEGNEKMKESVEMFVYNECDLEDNENYDENDLLVDIANTLESLTNIAISKNVPEDKIIWDPGIGFSKDTNQNVEILKNIDFFKQFTISKVLVLYISPEWCIVSSSHSIMQSNKVCKIYRRIIKRNFNFSSFVIKFQK